MDVGSGCNIWGTIYICIAWVQYLGYDSYMHCMDAIFGVYFKVVKRSQWLGCNVPGHH